MFFTRRRSRARRNYQNAAPQFEPLESRQLLSASTLTLHNNIKILSSATSSTTVQGYTPAQIKKAYGIDQVSFSNGTIAGDGSGQTIAIVDAFNDPTLAADLNVFDQQFGLAAANLTVVNQSGGSSLPATDAGWAGEISLDVEWAHAIAPGAKILLVEANSDSLGDLLSAVDTARNSSGVSTVTMSWGGSEFFSFNASESSSELADDFHFTTPSGHQGITFVASAGDSGSFSGVQWPASSPNVLSVGGTTLTTDGSGAYVSESSWSGTSGGFSQYEVTPSYQTAVNGSGVRSVPDVSYDGDPNTGFAVYDSTPQTASGQTYVGWQEVGGTSAGSPQWAAIVAIADQGRAIAGNSSLDGVSQTLPILYSLYSSPSSSTYSTYTSFFNDVIDAAPPGRFHFPFGGNGDSGQATSGYDVVTGLGTPKAAAIVDALTGTATTPTGPTTPTSPTTPTTPTLPASPLTATVISAPTGKVVGSQSGKLTLRITNTSTGRYTGPVVVSLYATTDGTISSSDSAFANVTVARVNVAAGKSTTVTVHFEYPGTIASGAYVLVASVNATNTNTAPSRAVAPAAITINQPTVDLSTSFGSATSVVVRPGHHSAVSVRITNNGNVTASGQLRVNLYASSDQTLDESDPILASFLRTISLKPGKSMTLHLTFPALSTQAGGTYFLIASASSNSQPADAVTGDKTAVIATRA